MDELMKITVNEKGQKAVSIRELYSVLGLQRTNFKSWAINNIIDNYYFSENNDWVGCMVNIQGNENN
ncbi:antA/AntB antirepressor family protein [Clostridium estertheticum]|uniref:antA/AntB antirepressor family protein n=1 Tax=Clostridium estertheticum TaxID=238834 RepID=UPI001C0DCB77|nr:antA/AntB antirepressor family protein [Clostridium estertheticum]MBU3177655.1 antA/AntB antirepressor family protein [Clostridium estertheticum]